MAPSLLPSLQVDRDHRGHQGPFSHFVIYLDRTLILNELDITERRSRIIHFVTSTVAFFISPCSSVYSTTPPINLCVLVLSPEVQEEKTIIAMADTLAEITAKLQLDEETGEMLSKNELKKRTQKRAKKAASAARTKAVSNSHASGKVLEQVC